MNLIVHNELTKLTANALDRASTACLTVGVFGPSVALLYGVGATANGAHGVIFMFGSVCWLLAAAILHRLARITLWRLR